MKATTLRQLKFINWITTNDIKEAMNKATFYNIINWSVTPTQRNIEKMCKLFDIEEKEFQRLLKNWLKKESK